MNGATLKKSFIPERAKLRAIEHCLERCVCGCRRGWKIIGRKYIDKKEARMPIEEALMAFVGIDIPKEEMGKGIPFVSFVVKEGGGAVFMEPLPLSMADGVLKERTAAESKVLYRVDYVRGGLEKFATGIFTTGEKQEDFLTLLKHSTGAANGKARIIGLYSYLEAHIFLCAMERLALHELSLVEKEGEGNLDYREADSAYYKEVLFYVEAGRRCLNSSISGVSLPPFPERGVFMDKWYRRHKGKT